MPEREMHGVDETKPNPDPTTATNDAVDRAMKSERDYVDGEFGKLIERLNGIDNVMAEKFSSIEKQLKFAEAQRVEQKADAALGLTAALSAQKEAASEQNRSNTLAIAKSEQSTAETIAKNANLFATELKAQTGILDDLKTRVDRIEAARNGFAEQRTDSRAQTSSAFLYVTAALAVLAIIVAVYLHNSSPKSLTCTTTAGAVTCR